MTDPNQLLVRAVELQNTGRYEAALAVYDELLSEYLGTAQVHTNRGLALFALGLVDDAIATYRAAVQCDATYFDAHYGMGMALFANRQFADALASFNATLAIHPSPDAYVSRGSTHLELMQHELALADYDAALAINPNYAKAHMNKGSTLYEMEREAEALACFDKALEINPSDPATEWNMALCLLRMGDLKRGWQFYERRREGRLAAPLKRAHYAKPRYTGLAADLSGKTVLLWPEQGHGDVMHFCRYALELERVGAKIILEVYPSLFRLMQTAFANKNVRVAPDGSVNDAEFDVHCPLLSMPLVCGTDSIAKIPASSAYLFADSSLAQAKQNMASRAGLRSSLLVGLRVGLVWAGGHRPNQPIDVKVDAARSIKLELFTPLLALAQNTSVQFVSLQAGVAASQMEALEDDLSPGLIKPGLPEAPNSDAPDWADTAALIAGLDLVISVDTAVAHLAAAMGKPTWILARFNGCWRWLQDRNDSPWYPTVRLFRQKIRGDWAGVIEEVKAALQLELASYNA